MWAPPRPLQLYKLGNKMELLAAVTQADRNNPDSPVTVNITTTLPDAGEAAEVGIGGWGGGGMGGEGFWILWCGLPGALRQEELAPSMQRMKKGAGKLMLFLPASSPVLHQRAPLKYPCPCCLPLLLAHAAVLHWGVKRPGRGSEWLAPPDNIKPPNTNMPGGNSAETPFSACTGGRPRLAEPQCQPCSNLPHLC